MIQRLQGMNVPMVSVRGNQEPEAEWMAAAKSRAVEADHCLAQTGALLMELQQQFRMVERQRCIREIKPGQLSGCIRALASAMSHGVAQEPPVLQLSWGRHDLAGHLANTAFYSLLLATNVPKYLRGQRNTTSTELWDTLSQLCTAATMHDVGKLVDQSGQPVRPSYDEPNELSYVAADLEYQKHTKRGANAFRDAFHSTVTYVIANHHQRFNGRGFPQQPIPGGPECTGGMAGTRIHIFARLVALANTLDHLFGGRLQQSDLVSRLHTLVSIQQKEERFDPVLLNAAVRLIPPFPAGVQVELTDGRVAAVLRNNVNSPCRPTVVPLPAPDTLPEPDAQPVDLNTVTDVHIAKVAGVDVRSQLYNVPQLSPDPLDYWALRDVLSGIPEAQPEPAVV
ncbi:MAG: HD domain-containing protein [Phycisphaerales bacterium]|nr:MAG: HD domain-containing protein [Phycisphaerales bacterium]